MTCRHFRYQVPREYADELRDADPEPCPVCDALPHRKAMAAGVAITTPVVPALARGRTKSGWLARWFGASVEGVVTGTRFTTPARASA